MKATLTPETYNLLPRTASCDKKPQSTGRACPDILYIEIKSNKIYYSICFLREINETETRPLRRRSLKAAIISIKQTTSAIILDSDNSAPNLIPLIKNICTRFNGQPDLPFLLFKPTSPISTNSIPQKIEGVDDIVSRQISIEDLDSKIKVLKQLKLLRQTALLNPPKDRSIVTTKIRTKRLEIRLKRVFDIVGASFLILLLFPVMLIIAILIKTTSKGPIIYKAERSGRNYQIFGFIKFRSMYLDADQKLEKMLAKNQYSVKHQNGPVFFKMSDDPRITPIGKFLRNTSLDELPQLFNVLRGEMSLVGNRPLPLYEAKTLTTDKYVERFDAPAGITGLWQVKKRGAKNMSVQERIDLDIEYARNHSPVYDVKIMLQTPKALIQKDNV